MEESVLAEGFYQWSRRRKRSSKASFTPYHPGALFGPYARGTYSLSLGEQTADPARFVDLTHAWTITLGVRAQLRLAKPAPPPEGVDF